MSGKDTYRRLISESNQRVAAIESKIEFLRQHIDSLTDEQDPDLVIEDAIQCSIDVFRKKIDVEANKVLYYTSAIEQLGNPGQVTML